jgi:Predicted nucleotide-binding protein containing TIR-like domain
MPKKPPTIEPIRASELLKVKIEAGRALFNYRYDDHRITEWKTTVTGLLVSAFGQPNEIVSSWNLYDTSYSSSEMTDSDYQKQWEEELHGRLAVLNSAVEQVSWQTGTVSTKTTAKLEADPKAVFLVHGRNNGAKETVARALEKLRLKPIILHEEANEGRTIVEKFETHANAAPPVSEWDDSTRCLTAACLSNRRRLHMNFTKPKVIFSGIQPHN